MAKRKKPKKPTPKIATVYHLNCGRCGDYFSARRKHAQFCSPACRKHASRWGVSLFPPK